MLVFPLLSVCFDKAEASLTLKLQPWPYLDITQGSCMWECTCPNQLDFTLPALSPKVRDVSDWTDMWTEQVTVRRIHSEWVSEWVHWWFLLYLQYTLPWSLYQTEHFQSVRRCLTWTISCFVYEMTTPENVQTRFYRHCLEFIWENTWRFQTNCTANKKTIKDR